MQLLTGILHTVLERLLEELSFGAPEMSGRQQRINAEYTYQHFDRIVKTKTSRPVFVTLWVLPGVAGRFQFLCHRAARGDDVSM
jgi:hypothetical protein